MAGRAKRRSIVIRTGEKPRPPSGRKLPRFVKKKGTRLTPKKKS